MKDRLLDVNEVAEILNRKQTYCYKVIRDLNNELKEKGFYINEGRVPKRYFEKRIGLDCEGGDNQ